ncbi:agmatine deiminase family protein [Candidatus Fukatsuia symbiotica]|nr:agmatine deiminase family protein [Candidatus Fukatsuia symbiotica]MEA9444642.1 agmatine deiminase family protein [Candidatus Fukatsuia symbiotica]
MNKERWFMPSEEQPHQRTWMAFSVNNAWGGQYLAEIQENIATIALAIARYETVTMLVDPKDHAIAQRLVAEGDVELLICPLDDIWIRDSGPVFVINQQGDKVAAIDFNFNGWGNKQQHALDAKVAQFIVEKAGVKPIKTRLVLEGGGIEVDGDGTAIITESCVINSNRNAAISKEQCEQELKQLLGLEKIIWLPGIKNKDITDGHTDGYVRFVRPGAVVAGYEPNTQSYDHLVTQRHLDILRHSTDAKGRQLDVVVLEAPATLRDKYASNQFFASYINYYVCNKAVIVPAFGDVNADNAAVDKLKRLYPQREIVAINIDAVASGGGGIHCVTQQEPKTK